MLGSKSFVSLNFGVVTGAGDAKKVAAAAAERKAREKAARQVPLQIRAHHACEVAWL